MSNQYVDMYLQLYSILYLYPNLVTFLKSDLCLSIFLAYIGWVRPCVMPCVAALYCHQLSPPTLAHCSHTLIFLSRSFIALCHNTTQKEIFRWQTTNKYSRANYTSVTDHCHAITEECDTRVCWCSVREMLLQESSVEHRQSQSR